MIVIQEKEAKDFLLNGKVSRQKEKNERFSQAPPLKKNKKKKTKQNKNKQNKKPWNPHEFKQITTTRWYLKEKIFMTLIKREKYREKKTRAK